MRLTSGDAVPNTRCKLIPGRVTRGFRRHRWDHGCLTARGEPLTITLMDSDRPEIETLAHPAIETRKMTIWNRDLVPVIQRELVRRPLGSDYFAKNPQLHGDIGAAARAWFQQGGILLPMFNPPVTPEWESFVEAQRSARSVPS